MQTKPKPEGDQGRSAENVVQHIFPFHRQGDHPIGIEPTLGLVGDRRVDTRGTRTSYAMYATLATLIDRLDRPEMRGTGVIGWGCPVLSFGDLSSARVATLGLNPSNREFVDDSGGELQGSFRRFHTLASLGIHSWSDIDARHLRLIVESFRTYFLGNPYDRWFKRLNQVVSGTKTSFYGNSGGACHLDLIPYATTDKWTELTFRQRSSLLRIAADALGLLLRDSPVRILILNGRSVVEQFQEASGIRLDRQEMSGWSLGRQPRPDVAGFAYKGVVQILSGIRLSNEILVIGFNHNLQSSFGVTNEVIFAIREWISQVTESVVA